jgi:hypothetical protein
MNASNGFVPPRPYLADECRMYRTSLPKMIRDHGPLTEDQLEQFRATGVTYDPISDTVDWKPRDGVPSDLNAERGPWLRRSAFSWSRGSR